MMKAVPCKDDLTLVIPERLQRLPAEPCPASCSALFGIEEEHEIENDTILALGLASEHARRDILIVLLSDLSWPKGKGSCKIVMSAHGP
jgi:hypothetical protein